MQLNSKALLRQIEELAAILKPWNEQLVVGGGVALILYDLILAKAHSGAIGTTDIDYLIPRKAIGAGHQKISDLLEDHGYEPKNKTITTPPVQSFTKQIGDIEFEVEFLTDNKSRNQNNIVQIKTAGVNAQALSYIEMSLREATPLVLPSGTCIFVVKPEAWVFHKGLTFTKRPMKSKAYKDLYGIWFVLTQLGELSVAVQIALPKLMKKSPDSWVKTFFENLKTWTDHASPQDWDLLERQDTGARLTRFGFLRALSTIPCWPS